jgi:hypothetical protein
MWELVIDQKTIQQAEKRLVRAFSKVTAEHIPCFAGYQGGNEPIEAWWSDNLGLWFAHKSYTYESGRIHWNVFGTVGKPRRGRSQSITCETNLGFSGDVRRLAGAVAQDEHGRLHLMHRGRIGGGRKGIGRTLFREHFRGEFVDIADGDSTSAIALVGDLDSPRLPAQVAHFVREVERIKALAGTPAVRATKKKFSKEAESRSGYQVTTRMINPSADHGLVVNALAKRLTRKQLTVSNDRARDLFLINKSGRIDTLFEIKTSSLLGDVYQAIGQLFYNSTASQRRPKLILVSPRLPKSMKQTLADLGITQVRYKISGSEVDFTGL